ncbi:hypothetical protein TNCV_82521 [Trichonephila clavipes]|nr:hypothetical protein TNCV_82521 [Trichonephila clavipes]
MALLERRSQDQDLKRKISEIKTTAPRRAEARFQINPQAGSATYGFLRDRLHVGLSAVTVKISALKTVFKWGCVSLVVMVTNSWLASSGLVPLKIRNVEGTDVLKSVEVQSHPHGVVGKFRERFQVQVASSSLDYGTKLRSPSPIALVLLYRRR